MKSWTRNLGPLALLVALCAAGSPAHADEAVAEKPAAREPLGLNVDLGLASAYNFRGLNVFQTEEQMDQNAYFAPAVTWSVMEGLTLGYWGAFQLVGDNASDLVDLGLGAEQDLIVAYSMPVAEDLSATFGVIYYLYPFADEDLAGTANPSYLEPSAGIAWAAGPVNVGLKASYFYGVQDAVRPWSYVYLNPTVARSFAITEDLPLDLALGLGFKYFTDPEGGEQPETNTIDVAFGAAVPWALDETFYVKPSVNAAWTNLDAEPAAGGEAPGFGDEFFVFGAVNVGANL